MSVKSPGAPGAWSTISAELTTLQLHNAWHHQRQYAQSIIRPKRPRIDLSLENTKCYRITPVLAELRWLSVSHTTAIITQKMFSMSQLGFTCPH